MSGPVSELLAEFGIHALDEASATEVNTALAAAGLEIRPQLSGHLEPATPVRLFPARVSPVLAPEPTPADVRQGDAGPVASPSPVLSETDHASKVAVALRERMIAAKAPQMSGPVSELLGEFGIDALDDSSAAVMNAALAAAGVTTQPKLTGQLAPTSRVRLRAPATRSLSTPSSARSGSSRAAVGTLIGVGILASLIWRLILVGLVIGGIALFIWGGSNEAHLRCAEHRLGAPGLIDSLACILEH